MISLFIGLAVLLLAIVLFFISGLQRRASGLPGGRVIYSDTRAWGAVEKPLFDRDLGLTGKPDYLVEQDGRLIPVEVKTGRTPTAPYDSHIFQLAAYCLLVHKATGKRPPYGIIHYPGGDFAVDYTADLENAVLDLIADIRISEHRPEVDRSHEDAQRCRGCGFRDVCDQRLG
ncbi:MAG TPA: CRISPR-associated protein Cas4 [Anaerolineales bacterium]|nr:CRISPR-associated protein Cas4 [Anaerolineales bacterium]